MAEIDSLELRISASMEKASASIDLLTRKLGVLAQGIQAIGTNKGIDEFIQKSQSLSAEMEHMGKRVSDAMKPIQEQAKKTTKDLSRTFSELQSKYGDLGKDFRFTGTDTAVQKQIDKYANALENAKLKKQELELAGKTEGQGYEDAVKNVLKYTNVIESLKGQLLSLSNTQTIQQMPEVRFYGFDEDAINKYTEKLREFDNRLQTAISSGEQKISSGVFEDYLSQLRKEVPEAKELILSYEEELRRLNEINTASNFGTLNVEQWAEQLRGTTNITEGLEQRIKSFREQLTQLQVPSVNEENLIKLQNVLQKTKEKMSLLKIEMANKLTMGKITESIDDSGYRNLREQIALTGKTIDALQARIQDVSERTRVSSAEMAAAFENNLKNLRVPPIHEENIEKLQMSLDKAGIKLEELQTKLANGLTMGRITENIDDSGYRNLREQIALTENQIEALRTRMQEVGDTSQYVGLLQSSLNGLRAVAHAPVLALEAVGNAVRSIPSKSIELASSAMQTLGSAAINTAKIITGSLLNGLKNTVLKIGSLSKSIAGLDKSNKGLNVSLGKGFSTLLKYGLGNRSVYTLINKMRRAIVEGFKNLAQYSNEVNANISMLKGSFNQLKNSMAAMLAPIFNAIAPALNQLIQLIIKATNVINQFIAALSGSSSWIRAKNQVVDYANSIKKAAKAAQKGARQFDELKMISTDNGGNDGGTNPGDMFETVPIDDKIMDWMNKFRDMWKNADFTELGSAIGDWLKNTLDNIDLDGIQTKAAKLGSSLATFLNGIFETDGLGYSIGNTLAQSINTAFEFLNEFVHKLHWDSLGKFIAETLNGLFSNIEWDLIKDTFFAGAKGLADAINSFDEFLDWNAISTTISNAFNTLVGTIRIFVGNVDWKQLGADIGKTISDAWIKIDWSEVGAMVGESFIAFFDFISSAIENVDWEGVAQTFEDFITGIDFSGVADSFFEAVGAAFGGLSMVLGKLLYDAVDSAKKYFQGKIEECGGNVVEGILKGIVDAITGIGQWVYDHIFSPFIKGFKEAFGIHSPSTVMEEQGNYIMEGLLNGITSLVDKVADTWESMKSTAVETWNTVKESLSETWENIKSDASTKFDTIKSNVSEAWENLKSDTSDKWSTIKSDLSDIWSDTKENASETFGNIKDSITDSWENLKKNTSDIWEQIKNVIKNPINAIISFINGLIGGVTSGINAMTSALNSISFDIPDWIPGIGGGKFGFDIPQISVSKIPMLAKGGIAMQYTPAIIGEAGAEAILPLTNSRAMGMIADSILDNISDGGYDNTDDREREIYSVVYNAVSAALNNSKRLREIDENIEKGHVIEADGRVFAKLVQAEANETFRRTGKPYFAF